jgi:ABC-2 type transport system permease protein
VTALVLRSLSRVKASLMALWGVLLGFQLILVAVAAEFHEAGNFERLAQALPAVLQLAVAPALTSFGNMTMLGYFDILVIISIELWAIFVASEPAGEVESGLVDLVLARPVPRNRLVTRSLIAMVVSTLLVSVGMLLGTFVGLLLFAPAGVAWPSNERLLVLLAHLNAIAWCFGTMALAVSGWARRRGAAIAIVSIAALGMYLLDIAGLWWTRIETLAKLTPVYYFHGGPIIAGTHDSTRDFVVLGGICVVATVVAYWQFARRDL